MGGLSHTVSGDIASFRTPSRVPIESLKFHFLPKQASGTPSPENPIPIEGWTGLNGERRHKNLIKPYYTSTVMERGLTITPTTKGVRVTGKATVEHPIRLSSQGVRILNYGKKYTFSLYINGDISGCEDPYLGYHDDSTYRSIQTLTQANNYVYTWTIPDRYSNAVAPWFDMYIRVFEGSTVDFEIGLQMEAGENATIFEPYSGEQIPITFPSTGKNRYHYDENNIEEGLTTTSGYTRSVYHTGVFGDGRNVSISGSIIEAGVVSNTSLNVGYLKDGIITPKHIFISYVDGSITSSSFVVPRGYEFVIITTGETGYGIKRNLPRYNIQIEYADSPTAYEPYSSDNTFYGGYIDPVAGEIVAEYGSYTFTGIPEDSLTYTKENTTGGKTRHQFNTTVLDGIAKNSSIRHAYSDIASANIWDSPYITNDNLFYIGTPSKQVALYVLSTECEATVESFNSWLSEHPWTIVFQLATPIHIPVSAEDMKAFLDHNNFWSDANDITEVTYPVTESKDILATRKKAMDFDQAHHKKVKWNQLVPISSVSSSIVYRQSDGSILIQGTTDKTDFIILTSKTQYFTEITGHKYFLCGNPITNGDAQMLTTTQYRRATLDTGYGTVYESEKDSDTVRLQMRLVAGTYDFTIVPVFIDLTVMFGAGKEPSTVDEVKRICEINGIDLTTYQPYDEGSDRWLIVP